jgi:hypothetical protein
MAWGATFDVPASIESYDQTVPLVVELTGGLADGCVVHFMSPTDGGYRVTEIWQSEDHWRRFRNEILTPLLQRLTGEDSPAQPEPNPFPVHAVATAPVES